MPAKKKKKAKRPARKSPAQKRASTQRRNAAGTRLAEAVGALNAGQGRRLSPSARRQAEGVIGGRIGSRGGQTTRIGSSGRSH